MIRKYICVFLSIAVMFISVACTSGADSGSRSNDQTGVEKIIQQQMEETDKSKQIKVESPVGIKEDKTVRQSGLNEAAPTPETVNDDEGSPDPDTRTEDGLDVDLTTLSSTMVYSEVYNMMALPEEYIGKTIKMDGIFSSFYDEATGKYYFACIIMDATACCSQGIEFELEGEHTYPDDYPTEGDKVCVIGTFDTYQEGEYTYCTLRNARIV
ncbi:MAG: hypothetical protein K5870_03995 [Lachnospiraceae bacterium]|nr:hypothetical protein [Lachnospiraceae bacterium]